MDEQAIRDTEALTYSAPEALSIGLADEIGTLNDSIAAFAVELETEPGEDTMAVEQKNETASAVDVEKVKADSHAAGKAEGVEAGRKEGAVAERERISAIFALDQAKTRPAAANMLAFDTDKSPEDCAKSLDKLPEEKSVAVESKDENLTANGFVATMNNEKKIDLGHPGEEDANLTEADRRYNAAVEAAMPAHNKKSKAA